jgi:hypothetical protein
MLLFARRAETGATLVIITHDKDLAAVRPGGDAGRRGDRIGHLCPHDHHRLGAAWRIARRDLHRQFRGLRLLLVCLFLGVGALAAIGTLTFRHPQRAEWPGAGDPRRRPGGRGLAAPLNERRQPSSKPTATCPRPPDAGHGQHR